MEQVLGVRLTEASKLDTEYLIHSYFSDQVIHANYNVTGKASKLLQFLPQDKVISSMGIEPELMDRIISLFPRAIRSAYRASSL